jgi:glucose-6-phosphate isomerase, archaeal
MTFDPEVPVLPKTSPLGFEYLPGGYGPQPEIRTLDSIHASLLDPNCLGPEAVYAIAMDVGRKECLESFREHMLLYGVVTYAAGRLGAEPVRSQGHIHRISSHSGWSPPELYEIWTGAACILMQEHAANDPGRCFAIYGKPGELVLVPPGWAHATISADPTTPLTFGALCDREYGFEYTEIRKRKGLAWYPLLNELNELSWKPNSSYQFRQLERRGPGDYSRFGIFRGVPLYSQAAAFPARFDWISNPGRVSQLWEQFEP